MSTRVFELAPAIDRIALDQDEKIETLEMCGLSLYVGTTESRIIRFNLTESKDADGRVRIAASKISEKALGPKSSVRFMRSASALSRLLVLCDGGLHVLNVLSEDEVAASGREDLSLLTLSGSGKLRGAQACCVNENPNTDDPFAVQMCLAKKKQVAIISITEAKLVVERICDLAEQITEVSMDGRFVCAALSSHYVILDVSKGDSQDLFPYEGTPAIARIAKEEFLLSAPGSLGMFVTSAGVSERPPIQWGRGSETVSAFAYTSPYVVALADDGIAIYSVEDQQHKQSLHFKGGRCVGNYDGRMLVASAASVYRVLPIPIQTQIKTLLDGDRIDQALALAESSFSPNSSLDPAFLSEVRARAGFARLAKMDTEEARRLLITSGIDARELISLYPGLLPTNSSFVRRVPPLHQMADVNASIARGDKKNMEQLRGFLAKALLDMRREGFEHKREIDTALVKLLSSSNASLEPKFLLKLLSDSTTQWECDFEECKEALEDAGKEKRLELAALCFRNNHRDLATSIWSAMLKDKDSDFPGMDFFIEKLLNCASSEGDGELLMWRHADAILGRDQLKGVTLFTRAPPSLGNQEVWQRKAAQFLHNGGYSQAHLAYLEFLVLEKESQVERFHSQLATAYLDLIETERTEEVRIKFRAFVVKSPLVQPTSLLSRLEKQKGMEVEKATLYGKMGDHDKALRMLALRLSDLEAAERHCDEMSRGKEQQFKKKLLLNLLRICLNPEEGCDAAALSNAARDLFNRRSREFDAVSALSLLPDSWSLASVQEGLEKAVQESAHNSRTAMVMAGLSKADNVNASLEKYQEACRTSVPMAISSYCMSCRKQFHEPTFARFPNGIIVHPECATKDGEDGPLRVCPVTGRMFSSEKR